MARRGGGFDPYEGKLAVISHSVVNKMFRAGGRFGFWFVFFGFWFVGLFGFWFADLGVWFAIFSFWFSVSDSRGLVSDSCILVSDSHGFWFLIRGIWVSDSRILVSDWRVLVSDSLLLIRGKFLIRGLFLGSWVRASYSSRSEPNNAKKSVSIILRRPGKTTLSPHTAPAMEMRDFRRANSNAISKNTQYRADEVICLPQIWPSTSPKYYACRGKIQAFQTRAKSTAPVTQTTFDTWSLTSESHEGPRLSHEMLFHNTVTLFETFLIVTVIGFSSGTIANGCERLRSVANSVDYQIKATPSEQGSTPRPPEIKAEP